MAKALAGIEWPLSHLPEQIRVFGHCRFGNTVLVHFEDMAHQNLDRLLSQYRGSLACFSDDVQARSDPSLLASALMPCMLRGSLLAVPSRSLLKGTAQGSFHKNGPHRSLSVPGYNRTSDLHSFLKSVSALIGHSSSGVGRDPGCAAPDGQKPGGA